MTCNTCGCVVLCNHNAGDWDWPYACTWCDRERLPEHLRADNPWNAVPKRKSIMQRVVEFCGGSW